MAADDEAFRERVDGLIAALRATRKYRHLCDDILAWAAVTALERQPNDRAALKFAKRKLHQAFGSFVADRKRLLGALREAADAETDDRFREALREALRHHASTHERGDALAELWDCLRAAVPGPLDSVLDLGCGAAPAALPWSGLPAEVVYRGVDLDEELGLALTDALRPRFPNVTIATADARQVEAWPRVDVAVLAKLLPTLERQEPGSASRLVARLDAGLVVATFPTQSLGGRDRGMAESYRTLAQAVLGPGTSLTVAGELVYLSRRTP